MNDIQKQIEEMTEEIKVHIKRLQDTVSFWQKEAKESNLRVAELEGEIDEMRSLAISWETKADKLATEMERQRNAIERVLGELNREVGMCEIVLKSDSYDAESKASKWAFDLAIAKLKEVLTSDEASDTDRTNGEQSADQI